MSEKDEGVAVLFYRFIHTEDPGDKKRVGALVCDGLARLERRIQMTAAQPMHCRCNWIPFIAKDAGKHQVRCSGDFCWMKGPETTTEQEAVIGWNELIWARFNPPETEA